jgi:hypothetical protein
LSQWRIDTISAAVVTQPRYPAFKARTFFVQDPRFLGLNNNRNPSKDIPAAWQPPAVARRPRRCSTPSQSERVILYSWDASSSYPILRLAQAFVLPSRWLTHTKARSYHPILFPFGSYHDANVGGSSPVMDSAYFPHGALLCPCAFVVRRNSTMPRVQCACPLHLCLPACQCSNWVLCAQAYAVEYANPGDPAALILPNGCPGAYLQSDMGGDGQCSSASSTPGVVSFLAMETLLTVTVTASRLWQVWPAAPPLPKTNRIRLVIFGIQNRTFGSYWRPCTGASFH